jgi:hypothetical protein
MLTIFILPLLDFRITHYPFMRAGEADRYPFDILFSFLLFRHGEKGEIGV